MKIVQWTAGLPEDDFWQIFQDIIDGKRVLPDDA
jgi:hypothetical protein